MSTPSASCGADRASFAADNALGDNANLERSGRALARWQRMAAGGKPQQKIVVACARELAGFVWAIATDQPLRN